MQQSGSTKKIVLAELKKRCKNDSRYDDGRILCSMCTRPHPIAKKAYNLFFESNLGDRGLFPEAAELERQVVSDLAGLLNAESAAGFIVSGGTEANLLAMQVAKKSSKIIKPEVILPNSAHFSFTKICNITNLKPRYAPLDGAFRVDISAVKKIITKNTVALVGTAGTAELGAVDPIGELSDIALAENLYLHVDAAFGGLVIPFQKSKLPFDFRLKGVSSITVDPHKMGLAAIPAGGILFNNSKLIDALKVETPYLSGSEQYTFVGTRTGASVASAWAVFKVLGREGYQKIVSGCMRITWILADGIKKAGMRLICEPDLNIIAFRSRNTKQLADSLWKRGWFVSYIPRYDCIRLVVMPHLKRKNAKAFLESLNTEEI